ncbi:MAG TPA: PAS domain-containing protein, partial [Pirellulales bacterium]
MPSPPASDVTASAEEGDGFLERLLSARDWSTSALGEPAAWPISLKTALRIVLASRRPLAVWWGADCLQLFNDAFREQLGRDRVLQQGTAATTAWGDVWDAAADQLSLAMSQGEGWTAPIAVGGVSGKDGSGALTLIALPSDDGRPGGFLCEWVASATNGSPTHSGQRTTIGSSGANLEERELRYRLVAEATGEYIWDWELATNVVVRNAGVATLFGYRPEEIGDDLSWGVSKVHPKDRDRVMRALRGAIDGDETSWALEYRFRRADGAYVEVATRGHIVRDASGRALRVIAATRDLTEQRRREQALRDVEQQFRAVTMNAPVAIFIKDLEGRYTLCNPLAAQALGR